MLSAALLVLLPLAQDPPAPITFESLVHEIEDPDALARFPDPPYKALRATSYNRESVAKDRPGWFADSDGTSCIREEENSGRHEWVIQEQSGPGCLTKFWTPYFYYDFNERVGPNVRIYLDGASEPMLAMPLIELVTQNDWRAVYGPKPPRKGKLDIMWMFGGFTARAGNFYMPIAFAKGCKITLDNKPFYYSVDSRAYPSGTGVRTTSYAELRAEVDRRSEAGCAPPRDESRDRVGEAALEPGKGARLHLDGARVVTALDVELDPKEVAAHPELLRQIVLRARFDAEECVWCPVGDFFGGPNRLQNFFMRARSSNTAGKLHCAWRMPFQESAQVELVNLGALAVHAKLTVGTAGRVWDARSMHFHATWRSDDVRAGNVFDDWNFVDIEGQGVFVGDQWTVLNLTDGWWGEGDEKIFVDDSLARGFPDHFGTGSEDYYGWAGGVNPTRADIFSQPFLANISVGSTDHDSTRGFNILARDRALDAIPFTKRFVFDMEASPGTDQRNPWNLLGYSAVTFWYAKPGAKSNRGADPEAAKKPLMSLEDLDARSKALRAKAATPR
ncbi:MAG: DUF2961 domain-containing protein [Planctomycetes bacterium]|nr:DUF2961 domain-containing protein [Planctomycetota bacterium]